ncbi:hypothetical protein Q1695_007129 [Nippostrongylus brasiliensis]|nr:hypothetical protein Q1695_007129 [Nippostrongylus brasiliensis]
MATGSIFTLLLAVRLAVFVATLSSHPKVLLISFDGFRYDLLNRTMTPNIFRWTLNSTWFVNGLKSQYTTSTAPNHMSIVTGMREVDHGIVSNVFIDTKTGKWYDYFDLTGREGAVEASLDKSWYFGDPIWLTNERSDFTRRSAVLYWPASDAAYPQPPHRPWLHRRFVPGRDLNDWTMDVDEIVHLFISDRSPVNFVAWYVDEPDHVLHNNGFYNGELNMVVDSLDKLFGYLIERFRQTGLQDAVDIILTSDHGHAQIERPENIMCVREFLPDDGYEIADHMIYPRDEEVAQQIYKNLTAAVEKFGYKVNVYLKENLPSRYFFSNSTRVGRIVIDGEIGSAASLKKGCSSDLGHQKGAKTVIHASTHNSDPERQEMRGILVVGGPSIIRGKKVSKIPENIDLYALMCKLLQIPPSPSSSSLSVVREALSGALTGSHTRFLVIFLLIPSAFLAVVAISGRLRQTRFSLREWSQSGYRPIHTDIFDVEKAMIVEESTTRRKARSRHEESSDDEF